MFEYRLASDPATSCKGNRKETARIAMKAGKKGDSRGTHDGTAERILHSYRILFRMIDDIKTTLVQQERRTIFLILRRSKEKSGQF